MGIISGLFKLGFYGGLGLAGVMYASSKGCFNSASNPSKPGEAPTQRSAPAKPPSKPVVPSFSDPP